MTRSLDIERRLGDWMRARLPASVAEFIMFGLKQAWACLFAGSFLVAILLSRSIWQDDWALGRNDALFIFALLAQGTMLALRLETWGEAKVILAFHVTGTVMEVYKLHMRSWSYPGVGAIQIGGVPLFTGFMYASIGSYMARVIRLFDMEFAPYPPFWLTGVLACGIYLNFFTHHFLPDIRWLLFAATIAVFWRTRIWFYPGARPRWMPLPLAAFLSAVFVWIGENVGTITQTWAYPGQGQFDLVALGKFGSWYLLLFVSFFLVTLQCRDVLFRTARRPRPKG